MKLIEVKDPCHVKPSKPEGDTSIITQSGTLISENETKKMLIAGKCGSKYVEAKRKLVLLDCIKEYSQDDIYQSEVKTLMEPIPQNSLQAYEYRIENIKNKAAGKFKKIKIGIRSFNDVR